MAARSENQCGRLRPRYGREPLPLTLGDTAAPRRRWQAEGRHASILLWEMPRSEDEGRGRDVLRCYYGGAQKVTLPSVAVALPAVQSTRPASASRERRTNLLSTAAATIRQARLQTGTCRRPGGQCPRALTPPLRCSHNRQAPAQDPPPRTG